MCCLNATVPDEVGTATADWVHWYKQTRVHSSIDYLSPVAFELHHWHASKTADVEPEAG